MKMIKAQIHTNDPFIFTIQTEPDWFLEDDDCILIPEELVERHNKALKEIDALRVELAPYYKQYHGTDFKF